MSGPPLSRLRANGLAGCALILACIVAVQMLPMAGRNAHPVQPVQPP